MSYIYIYNSNHSQPLSLSLQGVKLHFLKFKSQKGFSLVGVLVTSVLGIIIFQGIFTMQSVTMKSTKQIEGRLQSASINRAILETLSEGKPEDTNCTTSSPAVPCESACTNTLKGKFFDGSSTDIEILTAYNETKYPAVTTPSLPLGERVRYKKDNETSGVTIKKIEFTGNKDTKKGELKVFYNFVVLGKTETPAPFVFPVTIQTHQPNADDNTKEELLTCGIEAGSGGGEPTPCYKVTKDGHAIVGCDEDGNLTGASTTEGASTAHRTSTFFGYEAGHSNHVGYRNTFLGYQAGYTNTQGDANTFVGYQAGYSNNTEDGYNTFLGYQAGYTNTTGLWNTFLGSQAGYFNNTGKWNTFLGYYAGYTNTTGDLNTFLGYYAGFRNTAGEHNTFVGYGAGHSNTSGNYNTFIGSNAGKSNTTGSQNIYIGRNIQGLQIDKHYQLQIGDWIKGEVNSDSIRKTLTLYSPNVVVEGSLTCTGTPCGSGGGITKTDIYTSTTGQYTADLENRTYNFSQPITNFDLIILKARDTHTKDIGFAIADPNEITPSTGSSSPNNELGVFIDNAQTARIFLRFETTSRAKAFFVDRFKIVKVIGINFGSTTTTASSRVYKQNITPFEDYESSLGVIMDTPLFNYQYKKNYIFYDTEVGHTRMGVISEELPESLQIKEEGKPSVPDWVSVYGTLWAGIKALASRTDQIDELKKEIKGLRQELLRAKDRIDNLEKVNTQ